MNLYHTRVNLQLDPAIISTVKELVRTKGTISKYYHFNIELIDRLVDDHPDILTRKYGVHGTSTHQAGDTNLPHYDTSRQTALNFSVNDCGEGASTLFYRALPGSTKVTMEGLTPGIEWGKVVYGPVQTVDTLTLCDNQCVLINTDELHAVRNYARPNRIVLSIDCKVSYKEAYDYFAGLGLIEVDVLDSDRSLF